MATWSDLPGTHSSWRNQRPRPVDFWNSKETKLPRSSFDSSTLLISLGAFMTMWKSSLWTAAMSNTCRVATVVINFLPTFIQCNSQLISSSNRHTLNISLVFLDNISSFLSVSGHSLTYKIAADIYLSLFRRYPGST